MKSLITGFLAFWMLINATLAQVQITTGNGNVGPTITGAISASYTTPYSYQPFGVFSGSLTVTPTANGDLSTGAFYDGISYAGTVVCPSCNGEVSVSFPMLNLQDSFTLTSSSGADVPWTISVSGKPIIAAPNAQIIEGLGVGGNVIGQSLQECFSADNSCNGYGANGANNVPFTISFSGTVGSGGQLTFSASTFGYTQFAAGPTPVSISASMAMDPGIDLIVPEGTTVVSNSGVFPVTFAGTVPEPPTLTLCSFGLILTVLTRRRKMRLSSSAA